MFETVQIARRHLMRYEHPNLDSAMEASASWSSAFTGALSSWFVASDHRDGSIPGAEEPDEADGEDEGSALLYCWPNYPY